MGRSPTQAADSSVRAILAPFGRHLRAENRAASTILTYSRAVEQLAAFHAESPMARMKPPHVPVDPPAVPKEDDLKALLKTCAGTDFDDRRHTAIIRLFLDTGVRRGELAGLRLSDVDPDADTVLVLGKGRRPRVCPSGRKTSDGSGRCGSRARPPIGPGSDRRGRAQGRVRSCAALPGSPV